MREKDLSSRICDGYITGRSDPEQWFQILALTSWQFCFRGVSYFTPSHRVRTPSMRRPVSVKPFLVFSSFPELFPLSQAASVATLPSALLLSDCRSVHSGCS